jgi:hypothetical protein
MRKLLLLVFLSLAGLLQAQSSSRKAGPELSRKARIEWKKISGARRYEIEIAVNPRMDPLVLKKESESNRLEITVKPGSYFFRVRAFDAEKLPGAWSPVEGFVVNPHAPKLIYPRRGERIAKLSHNGSLVFNWSAGLKNTQYRLEVFDRQGTLLSRKSGDNSLEWQPLDAGPFEVRVGFESLLGTEWGERTPFEVLPQALPPSLQRKDVDFHLLRFRTNGLYEKQKGNADSYSGQAAWVPTLSVSKNIEINSNLGLSFLRHADDSRFMVIDGLLGLDYRLGRFILSFQGGVQYWQDYGIYPLVEAGMALKFHSWFERLFFSGGYLFDDNDNSAYVLKVGIGFDFGTRARPAAGGVDQP